MTERPEELNPSPGLSRRQVLLFGAAATGLLATAYAGFRQIGHYPPSGLDLKHIDDKSVAVFRLIGDFVIPPGGPLPGHGGDDETLRRIDRWVGSMPPSKQRLFAALPLVFEHGPALDRFGSRCLTQLSPERQREYLTHWAERADSVRGAIWNSAKLMLAFSYTERPDVLEAMGWPDPCWSPA